MGSSRFIGRVGALAMFLGVGVSLTTAHGIAYAEPSPPTTASTTVATPPSSGDQPAAGGTDLHKRAPKHKQDPSAATPTTQPMPRRCRMLQSRKKRESLVTMSTKAPTTAAAHHTPH